MGRYVDITGQKYGRLTALSDVGKDIRNGRVWRCLCECGNYVNVPSNKLRQNHTRSCGCWKNESASDRFKTHGQSRRTPEYRTWSAMKTRCTNPNAQHYDKYGGRGISISPRWVDNFDNFYEDMGPKPSPKHSIDRIDVNGNYEPGNCRWATKTEQSRNTRLRKDNTSGVRGVAWFKPAQKWRAQIRIDMKFTVLGYYNTFEEAVEARLRAEQTYWNKKPS